MIRKLYSFVFLIVFVAFAGAQITYGKVTYERKTNLYKRLKHWEDVKEWVKEGDKVKIDEFELTFTDSVSCFKPVESEYRDNFEWATSLNTTYQNKVTDSKVTFKKIWGEEFMLKDSLSKRKWKITDGQRIIAGFNCRKAIWVENDSSRVYAWYADEIVPGFGPESFNGLPGLILGLASEDGGTIYFAKKVEVILPKPEVFQLPKTKKKPVKTTEFREQLAKQYGKEKWGKAMLLNNFGGVN
ncbi:MAG: GLPGLI family protein [Bacteroidota bacterium]|nr:GLPGLI family protein [Bacteroidota bacterium]